MQSMGHGGGCLRIRPSRSETQLCVLRIVIGVNEIVQYAWMVRLPRVHLFEKFRGLPLPLESLGPFRNSPQNRQSIEQLRFVVWIFGVYGRHRVAVILVALRFGSSTSILEQSG